MAYQIETTGNPDKSLSLWRKRNAGRENWNAVSNLRAINADRLR